MDLTVAQVAALLHRTPRAVRYMIKQNKLRARTEGGQYLIQRSDIPMTAQQQQTLDAGVAKVRRVVEKALPSAGGTTSEHASTESVSPSAPKRRDAYSTSSLEAFRQTLSVVTRLCSVGLLLDPPVDHRSMAPGCAMVEGLRALCDGAWQFHPGKKDAAFTQARHHLCRAVTDLWILESLARVEVPSHSTGSIFLPSLDANAVRASIETLEQIVLPSIGGLLKRVEKRV